MKKLEWTATIMTLIGGFLIADRNVNGWYLCIAANVLWWVFNAYKKQWGVFTLITVNQIVNVYALYRW